MFQKFRRRAERLHLQVNRLKEALQRLPDALVIVDDENYRFRVGYLLLCRRHRSGLLRVALKRVTYQNTSF